MYANPRVLLNNILFHTDVNDSSVCGNIASLSFYGDPTAQTTWHLGGSYLWHEIDGNAADITVSEPLAKAGLLFCVPIWHLSLNPYVGHGCRNRWAPPPSRRSLARCSISDGPPDAEPHAHGRRGYDGGGRSEGRSRDRRAATAMSHVGMG